VDAARAVVLNVAADPAVRQISSGVLRRAGFDVIEADSYAAALDRARQKPDVMVLHGGTDAAARCRLCAAIKARAASDPLPILHLVGEDESCALPEDCGDRVAPDLRLPWPVAAPMLIAAVENLAAAGRGARRLAAARREEEAFAAASPVAFYQVDGGGHVLAWGAAAERMFGWREDEVRGRFLPIVPPEQRDEFLAMVGAAFAGNAFHNRAAARRDKSGRMLPVSLSMAPLSDAAGHAVGVQIVAADMSQQQKAHREQAKLLALLRASPDLVAIVDAAGRFDYLNPAGGRLLGVSDGECAAGRSYFDFLTLPARQKLRAEIFAAAERSGAVLDEATILPAGGDARPISQLVVPLPADEGARYAVIGRDIAPQKRVAESLQRANRILEVHAQCTRALLAGESEEGICRTVVERLLALGRYRHVTIRLYAQQPGAPLLQTAAAHDSELATAPLAAVTAAEEGFARRAIALGGPLVEAQPADAATPWRILSEDCVAVAAALPIDAGGGPLGVITLLAGEANAFDDEEIARLGQLALHLATGIGAVRDAAARAESEKRLRLFGRAIESSDAAVMITDAVAPGHPIVYVNAAFETITGYAPAEVLGRSGRFLVAGDMHQAELDSLRNALRAGSATRVLLRSYRKDGSLFWNDCALSPVSADGRSVSHFVSILSDVTDKVRSQGELAHVATHDPLTGLANRMLLADRIAQAIAYAERYRTELAVMLIDLDHFKEINDSLGHTAGDMLLQEVAGRLAATVRDGDTVARLGGDEFVVVVGPLKPPDGARIVAEKIRTALAQPIVVRGREIAATPSIGYALYPEHARNGEELLRQADIAMYRVKAAGRNGYRAYEATMEDGSTLAHVELQAALAHALARGELELHYQPKVELDSGEVAGVEALIRWRHPERGLIPPGHFIPLAEESGLIVDIGDWVLREACRQARAWRDAALPPLRIAVNLSARQLRQDDLAERVAAALADAGVDAGCLEIELTESMVMQNLDTASRLLQRLKNLGVTLAMDDFGTGYSSLGYLRRFPFDTLKIDRSFVQDITTEPEDALIAVAVIAMAHSLGLKVVAEGVEAEAQMRYLQGHRCDEIQGYYYCKPLPAAAATDFLRMPPRLRLRDDLAGGRTLLIVDDEESVLASLKRLLRRSGYRILAAHSGEEALELLAINDVQVVLSDQRMPGMSGAELLARVKDLYPQTVRMVLSGYADLDAVTDAVNRGAIYKYLTKPWDDRAVREIVRDAFQRHDQSSGNVPASDAA